MAQQTSLTPSGCARGRERPAEKSCKVRQIVSSKEQVNVACKSVSQAIHAQKPLSDAIAKRQKTKLLFKRGTSGLPLSVEQAMLEDRSHRSGDLEMRYERKKMLQKSLRGKKYWEHKENKIQPEETISPNTEGFLTLIIEAVGKEFRTDILRSPLIKLSRGLLFV